MTPAFGHSYGKSGGKRQAGAPNRLSPKGWPPAAAQRAAPNSGDSEIGALSGVDGGGMCEWGVVAISLDGRRDTLLLAVVFPRYSAA
jgi:hypothetical protein